ncbi:MAG TPA: hypothetical protein VFL83_09475 [Anaeromyxobacter sp.]|nr:hypothetical protein [Anaeromyxobacter sp.]
MTARLLALSLLALAACSEAARVELQPPSLRFGVRGQTAKVHAAPYAKSGKSVPDQICKWSSSDEKVATVAGPANDAVVTAVGPGNARVRCAIGSVTAELDVLVRVVARVDVEPRKVDLRMLDEPAPVALTIVTHDDGGAPVLGRAAFSRCANENVCRGDGRGQLWAVGPGDTTAVVEVEGAKSEEIAVHVVDARTAAGKPKAVKGNPMLEVEREYLKKVAEDKKAEERARKAGK